MSDAFEWREDESESDRRAREAADRAARSRAGENTMSKRPANSTDPDVVATFIIESVEIKPHDGEYGQYCFNYKGRQVSHFCAINPGNIVFSLVRPLGGDMKQMGDVVFELRMKIKEQTP